MKRIEPWFASVMLLVIIAFSVRSLQYDFLSNDGLIGKGFFPTIFCISLLVLVGFYTWKVFIGKSNSDSDTEKDLGNLITKKVVSKQLVFLFSLILCIIAMEFLGTIVSLGIFIVIMLKYVESISWLKSISIGAGTTICLFLIFIQWLNATLPRGLFF